MSGTLALASALAEMDRDALDALVRRRRPHAPASISDPIALATELLRTDSIARALAPLDRTHLAALREPSASAPALRAELVSIGLLGRDGAATVPLPEVGSTLNEALATAQVDPESLGAPAPESADAPETDTSAWYSSALTAVGQSAECLRALRDRPGKLNRSGSIAVATVKQLAEATGIAPDDVTLALATLHRARLITTLVDDHLLVTAADSSAWLELAHVARWLRLAEAAARTMPAPLRHEWDTTTRHATHLRSIAEAIPDRYPLLPHADLAAIADFTLGAEYLGLTVDGELTPVAESLLAGREAAADAARAMPAAAAGVYVQPDLSVVVPGPLDSHDEAMLAALTRPEHIGIASTRRITESSIAEAYGRGLTPSAARDTFARISLTGIPQPLEYLLGSIGERIGGIVIDEHDGDAGRTRLSLARADLAATLVVDRALQHLQLQRSRASETELFSRLSPDHVLAALADARYHASSRVAALGGNGAGTAAARGGAGSGRAPAGEPDAALSAAPSTALSSTRPPAGARGDGASATAADDALGALVERVFTAARSEPGTGEFTRRLELAIRDRSPVVVTAESRGQVRTFTLLPVSVNAGRLRAADQAAGVERTLPVSMITSVDPA